MNSSQKRRSQKGRRPPNTGNSRNAASRQQQQRPQASQQQQAAGSVSRGGRSRSNSVWKTSWKAVNTNGVVAVVVSVILTALLAYFANPSRAVDAETIKTDQSTIKTDKAAIKVDNGQLKADQAQISALQEQNATAISHDANEVNYGLRGNGVGSQVWIMNASGGWIRDMTLVVPVAVQESRAPGGGISINFPNFSVYGPVGPGFTGETCNTTSGCTFRDPLLDLGPCMEAETTILKSLPGLSGAAMAKSSLYFNDPNGISWVRTGNGPPVRNTTFQGSGPWTPYASQRRISGCVVGG